MTLKEKLELWVKITGVDPNQTSYSIRFDGGLSTWDIKKMNDRITEALKYDEYGYFADAYLSVYFKKYLAKKQVSLQELLENKQMQQYMEDVKNLYYEIQISDSGNQIMDAAKKALDFYGLQHSTLEIFDIVELQVSANRCMDHKLRKLQFSTGTAASAGFKVSKNIYMYKNLDALLLCAANHTIDGVSLGYIRNEEQLTDSYFAFIIRNGQNLYLLTDMPKYSNPVQNRMSRCPGRGMSERIESNFFPYQSVANIDTSDLWDSGRYGIDETSNALAEQSDQIRTLIGTFDSLDEQEAFWTVTMLDMIKKEFYEQVPQYELSYTGSMIQTKQLPDTENALAIRSMFSTIELQDIDITDTMEMEFEQRKDVDGANDDLIERYKDQIDPAALNLVKETERFSLMSSKYKKQSYGETKPVFIAFDRDTCGTRDEILYTQKYIERYNYFQQIQRLMDEDFKKNRKAIEDQIQDRITPRIRELCKLQLQGKLMGRIQVYQGGKDLLKEMPFGKIEDFEHWYKDSYDGTTFQYGYEYMNKKYMHCYFTNKKAGVIFIMKPRNLQDLLLLCGCEKSDLPKQIQKWHNKPKYYGNQILRNIDPLLWNVDDPFEHLEFSVSVLVSQKEYLALCKEAGVEEKEFWKALPPTCYSEIRGVCKGKRRYLQKPDGSWGYQLNKKCVDCDWRKGNA